MLESFVTYIGPWTFLYGAVFAGLALGIDRFVRWLGMGLLVSALVVLKDLPGTFFATSLYLLFGRARP